MCNVQLPHKNLVVNELKAPSQRDIQSAKKNCLLKCQQKEIPRDANCTV